MYVCVYIHIRVYIYIYMCICVCVDETTVRLLAWNGPVPRTKYSWLWSFPC